MKVGIRKPSIKKSISARTTGKVKRKLKRVANPLYGKKGMGWVKNPKKALSNRIYKKTTVSAKDAGGCLFACIWYPIYWCCILAWWMIKYTALGMWWLGVLIVNGIIALVEWIINRNTVDITEETVDFAIETEA